MNSRDFSASRALSTEQVHKKLGGSIARAPDTNWPKGYSIPCDVRLSMGEAGWAWQSLLIVRLGIRQWVMSNCIVNHQFCIFYYHYYYYYYYYYYFFLCCSIELSLSQTTSFTFFPVVLPIPVVESEQAAVWFLVLARVKSRQWSKRLDHKEEFSCCEILQLSLKSH